MRYWYENDGEQLALAVQAQMASLRTEASDRFGRYSQAVQIYGNTIDVPWEMNSLSQARVVQLLTERLTFNVTQSCIDSLVSRLSRNRPLPTFITTRGNWEIQYKARQLNQFVEGLFSEFGAHKVGIEVFKDASVLADGYLHVYRKGNRVAVERVPASEIYVPKDETMLAEPRTMFRPKILDFEVLKNAFPDKASDLEVASLTSDKDQAASKIREVVEAWHLPSGEGAGDGRHVIACGSVLLVDEEYEYDSFPFARISFARRMFGYYSQSLVEQILPIQTEINKVLWTISRSYHLAGSFKVFLPEDCEVSSSKFDNSIGTIIRYRGPTAPTWGVPPVLAPGTYEHLENLASKAYRLAGISELSAGSVKPPGLNSGRAIMAEGDRESDRWVYIQSLYEDLYVQTVKLAIRVIKEIKSSYRVKVVSRRFLDQVEWGKVKLDEDQYELKCSPASALPRDFPGRLESVSQLAQANYIDTDTAKRMLDMPDLDQQTDLDLAPVNVLHMMFEKMAVEQEYYQGPQALDNLQQARILCLKYYHLYRQQNLPEDRLDKFREYLSEVDDLEAQMNPPASAAVPVPGDASAGPMAVPLAPPTSDILPIA
jgi:hypothetical protein